MPLSGARFRCCEQLLDAAIAPIFTHGKGRRTNILGRITQVRLACSVAAREKRSKGKTVTVITGLNPAASNLNAILAKLKTTCAAGGTVNDGKIEIQGDHRERALSILQELGYPAKLRAGLESR